MDRSTTRWTYRVVFLLAVTLLLAQPHVGAAQTQQTNRVMRQKLAESQLLLGALVTSDWRALASHSQALQMLTMQPGWDVLRLPEFHNYTTAFQKAIQAVADAAGTRDQRNALTAYNALVSSCVECHRYVARARIASAK
jgi:cytochrome c556